MESRPMNIDFLGGLFPGARSVRIDTIAIPSFSSLDLRRMWSELPTHACLFPRCCNGSYSEVGADVSHVRVGRMA